jgi:hypothetical protein
VRDELLADLVRAAAAPEAAGLGEIERLEHELRTEPEHRRWIEWAAPRVLRRFRAANEGDGEEAPPVTENDRIAVPLRVTAVVEGEGAPGIEGIAAIEGEAEAEAEAEGPAGGKGPRVHRS